MNSKILRSILPPILYDLIYRSPLKRYGWSGHYKNWNEALRDSKGYEADEIIARVSSSVLKVKNGEAVYERDSVLFNKIQYDWPVLAALMWVASQKAGSLNVLDFGGSLGSTYYQNRKFLTTLNQVRWNIVEQVKFVEVGKKNLEDGSLKFYSEIKDCLSETTPHVILLSSVLSYVEQPYQLIKTLAETRIQFMIIDRLPVVKQADDRLTIQKVSPKIYPAIYPAWFFSEVKFMQFIARYYEIVEDYSCDFRLNIPSEMKGLILKRKDL